VEVLAYEVLPNYAFRMIKKRVPEADSNKVGKWVTKSINGNALTLYQQKHVFN
jgi:hypothetical protein